MTQPNDWAKIRSDFHVFDQYCYFNTASTGAVSNQTIAFSQSENDAFLLNPSGYREEWMFKKLPLMRKSFGQMLGCDASTVALIQNYSLAINFIAEGLTLPRKILLLSGDYPSISQPFINRNYEICYLHPEQDGSYSTEKLEQLIESEKPSCFALGQVQWSTGFSFSAEYLSDLRLRTGIFIMLDLSQSIGFLSIDLAKTPFDIVSTSTYKWMCAGFGNGLLHVNPDAWQHLRPCVAGFNSFDWNAAGWSYTPGIRCFEPGHLDHDSFNRLYSAGLQWMAMGKESVQQRGEYLMGYLVSQLRKVGISILFDFDIKNRAGIVFIEGNAVVKKQLEQERILCVERNGGLRLSIHFYNNESGVDQLIATLLRLPFYQK